MRTHTDSAVANRLNEFGRLLDDKGHRRWSRALYRCARLADPSWGSPAYNLGLSYKQERSWRRSMQWNQVAARDAGRGDPALWNLGIAATAIESWSIARYAWKRFGIDVPDGEGPLELDAGIAPIRVNPAHAPEVVWASRIDPARAVIRSVPLPQSRRRYGDLVLNDGAPNGHRLVDGREYSVFDELELLAPSSFSTYELQVEGVALGQIETVIELINGAQMSAENWTTSLQLLCKSCSEGKPYGSDHSHDHGVDVPPTESCLSWRLGVAARSAGDIRNVVEAWRTDIPEVAYGVTCLLDAG